MPDFHTPDRFELPRLVCMACQRDACFLFGRVFGLATILCLCDRCGRAMMRKWPEAGD